MDKLKQWVTLTVLGSVVILAIGWLLLVSPKKGEAADLHEQATTQVVANATLETQLQVLRAQAKELPKKQAELAQVAAKIPDNPSLPSLIRALTAASTSAGVDFVSVTPGPPAAVAAPAAVAGAAAQPQAAAAATAQTTPTAATAAAATGAAGTLATIPVALNVVGDYFAVAQFISNLENLPRALRITALTLAPGISPSAAQDTGASTEQGRSLTTTITGTVFVATGLPVATAVPAS